MKKALALLAVTISLVISLAACSGIIGHVHQYGDWITTKIATCAEAGEQTRYCDCGDKQSDTIAVIGHNYVDGECVNCGDVKETSECKHTNLDVLSAVESTCTETGLTEGSHCSVCNFVIKEQEIIPANGHDNPVIVEPTCTTYGYRASACTVCGENVAISVMDPIGHNKVVLAGSYEAECEKDGVIYWRCLNEGCLEMVGVDIVPMLGHDEKKVHYPATCYESGKVVISCATCNKKLADPVYDADTSLNPDNHHALETRITSVATCTKDGSILTYCSCCNYTKTEIIPMHHNWDDGTEIPPTCNTSGYNAYICTYCGETKTTANAPEHEWRLDSVASTAPTCNFPGYSVYTCVTCGIIKTETVDISEHALYVGEIIEYVAPSCGQDGRIVYACSACGAQSTEKGEKFDPLNPAHHGYNGKPTWACHNPNHVYYVHPDGTTGTEPCDCHETTIYRLGNCYTYELVQYYCSVCDFRYLVIAEGTGPNYDDNGNIIHKDLVIDTPAIEPTCGEPGWTAVWHCECCGEKSGDRKPVDKIAHANKYFVEASPTVGNIEYCPDCGTYFYVVNGENKESNQMPFVDSVNHN